MARAPSGAGAPFSRRSEDASIAMTGQPGQKPHEKGTESHAACNGWRNERWRSRSQDRRTHAAAAPPELPALSRNQVLPAAVRTLRTLGRPVPQAGAVDPAGQYLGLHLAFRQPGQTAARHQLSPAHHQWQHGSAVLLFHGAAGRHPDQRHGVGWMGRASCARRWRVGADLPASSWSSASWSPSSSR